MDPIALAAIIFVGYWVVQGVIRLCIKVRPFYSTGYTTICEIRWWAVLLAAVSLAALLVSVI